VRLFPPAVGLVVLAGTVAATAPAAGASASPTPRPSAVHHAPTRAQTFASIPIAHGMPSDGRTTVVRAQDRRGRAVAASAPLVAGTAAHQSGLRASSQQRLASGSVLSTWSVTYETPTTSQGDCATVSQAQHDAFDRAVTTWAHTVASTQTVTVDVCIQPLPEGQLGGAGPAGFQRFGGAYFPNALANAITGGNGNGRYDDGSPIPDISAVFSNQDLYYYGVDPAGISTATCTASPEPDQGCYDFESVVLHELGHGLGFVGSVDRTSAGHAAYGMDPLNGDQVPFVYDLFTETSDGTAVLKYPNFTTSLYNAVTSNVVYWDGPEGGAADAGREPRLYAPPSWLSGSSYSHLSDASYPQGDANSLMTPFAEAKDVTRDPGEVMLGMFRDMGWVTPALPGSVYVPLPNPVQILNWGIVNNGAMKDLVVAGSNGVPVNATAVVLNLSAAATPSANSQLAVYARPRPGPQPPPARYPNVVAAAGYVKDGTATVPLAYQGVRFRNAGGSSRNFAVVVGYFVPAGAPTAAPYTAVADSRVVNTINGTGTARGRIGQAARTVVLGGLPASTTAVALQVTGVKPTNTSSLQVYSSDLSTPSAGALRMKPGQAATNLVIVKLGADHGFKLRTSLGNADVVADLVGYYDPSSSPGLYRPVLPQRLFGPVSMGPGVTRDAKALGSSDGFGVQANATALVLDTIAAGPTADDYLTTYVPGPFTGTTTVSLIRGKLASGPSQTKPSAGGSVRVRNAAGTARVDLDLFGYYAP
jgi:hypothetical protein